LKREAWRLASARPASAVARCPAMARRGAASRLPGNCASRDATNPREVRYAAATGGLDMNSIVYIVGAVVIVIAILSFLGLR
jgi:hypothetical protein